MPELKHTFTSGRMNKDLDERLVPNGEYRDAQNIEVLTSEGSDVGTVQTCLGNTLISDLAPDNHSKCVGGITDDKTNSIYYFIAGTPPPVPKSDDHTISSDLVVEYNSINNETLPVIVDIYNVQTEITSLITGSEYEVSSVEGLRVGMKVDAPGVTGSLPIITEIPTSTTIILSENIPNVDVVNFTSPRVLNFHEDRLITGVNIVDDMLFWTDNYSEPKKVNITRGKQGSIPEIGLCQTEALTGSFNYNTNNPYIYNGVGIPGTIHTELIVDGGFILNLNQNGVALNSPDGVPEYIQEKHITVIKKAPLTPPKLDMFNAIQRFSLTGLTHNTTTTVQNPGDAHWWGEDPNNPGSRILAPVGMTSTLWNTVNTSSNYDERIGYFDTLVDYRIGDVLLVTDDEGKAFDSSGNPLPFSGDDVRIRLQVISSDSTSTNPKLVNSPGTAGGNLEVKILYIDPSIIDFNSTTQNPLANRPPTWYVRLEDDTQSLYELKFPKFAYRYKYEDGEYSAFSPFSKTAFLPQEFEYHPKKGYNKAMVNGLKQLFIKDFIPPNIPLDVVEIDILYKESDSPNIYTIRSFKSIDPEWDVNGTGSYRGYFEIKDDLIHAVVASNQLLRPWDNVPRKALGQELTGNRLIYGNYLQNYNLEAASGSSGLDYVKPEFKTTIESDTISELGYPETSLKSMRTYQLGIVYKDVYGRETPVITHPSGVAKLDSSKAVLNNKFTVQALTPPPHWADSFKYFVKETSNEYYNLAMDRWYNAEEGEGVNLPNIWLSFPSEDRNKVDEETTLILKKTLETDENVSETGFVSENPRKKIIAIENEAPDFIKTTWAPIGLWDSETASNDVGNFSKVPNGFPYKDRAFIKINENDWRRSEFASLQNDKNTILNGGIHDNNTSLMIRFSDVDLDVSSGASGGKVSNWYNISDIAHSWGAQQTTAGASGDPGHYTINIDGSFGEDVEFLAKDSDPANIIDNIYVEIAKKTIENKAEFDGRFFVKIEYDGLEPHLGAAVKHTTQQNWIVNSHAGTMPVNWLFGDGLDCVTTYNSANNSIPNTPATTPQDMTSFYGDSNGDPFTDPPREIWWNPHGYTPLPPFPPSTPGISSYPGGRHFPFRLLDVPIIQPSWITAQLAGTYWKDVFDNIFSEKAIGGGGTILDPKPLEGWFIDSEPALEEMTGAHSLSATPRHYVMAKPGLGADVGMSTINISKLTQKFGFAKSTLKDNFNSSLEKDIAKKLTTKGTRFRFASDPDKTVYEIGSSSWEHLFNYHGGGSNRLEEAGVHRIRFTINLIEPFSRTSNTLSGITKEISTSFAPHDNAAEPTSTQKNTTLIEFVEPAISHQKRDMPGDPAVWETEPKDDVGLDIYYEIGQTYPVNMCDGTEELYIQPGATVSMYKSNEKGTYSMGNWYNSNIWIDGYFQNPGTQSNPSGATPTNTTILPRTNITTTNDFSHSGYSFAFSSHPNRVFLDSPFNPNIVTGLIVEDSLGLLPANTTVQSIGVYFTGPFSYSINFISLSNPPSSAIPNGTMLTFTGATNIYESEVIIPTVVTSITGCAGDIPFESTQPSTLVEFNNGQVLNEDDILSFTNPDGTIVTATVAFDSPTNKSAVPTFAHFTPQNQIFLKALAHGEKQTLAYHNCYTYGNGVESNRIRDLFNAVTLDKGVKASTTLAEQYKEEDRKSGLIFSGIYNSMNGVNRLNQFIMADNITKDLNPEYGSVQKLHSRDDDLVTLCEDKVIKVLAHKDALFNADDTKNITTSSNVLGYAKPFVGEYGISKNPESFASEAFRTYFTDRERGAVLRLSRDGLTPISGHGMTDWFADNLNTVDKLIGGYDNKKSLYNITLKDYNETPTVSFSEKSKGWVSFKTFNPESSFSLNNNYYTAKDGMLWRHHDDSVDRNSFYSIDTDPESETFEQAVGLINSESSITVLFNDLPSVIKSFTTLNYEGSQSRIIENSAGGIYDGIISTDNKYYNNQPELGWYVNSVITDQQTGTVAEFINKEGKWFNYIVGEETIWKNGIPDNGSAPVLGAKGNLDTKEFSTQGIGMLSSEPEFTGSGES